MLVVRQAKLAAMRMIEGDQPQDRDQIVQGLRKQIDEIEQRLQQGEQQNQRQAGRQG